MAVTRCLIGLRDSSRFTKNVSAASRQVLKDEGREQVSMGMGLHAGNAVKGAIGSGLKLDVTFISAAAEVAEKFESRTKEFGVPVLMSSTFYGLLGRQSRGRCRILSGEEGGAGSNPSDVVRTFDLSLKVRSEGHCEHQGDLLCSSLKPL